MYSKAVGLIVFAVYAAATAGVAAEPRKQNYSPWHKPESPPVYHYEEDSDHSSKGWQHLWRRLLLGYGAPDTDDAVISPTNQNGNSKWGSLNQSTLPFFSSWSGSGLPWGGMTTTNANPYTSCNKVAGTRTRSYDFTVALCDIKPDGVMTKGAVCINGQFPGPLIEANYGDMIQVTVRNGMTDEGTSMHWHGFLQTDNCQNDGVPGVQQCPIAPGKSYTYTMKAELYGSSWYHTHYSAQYAGGAVGPIVVHGPCNSPSDVLDLGPVMLSEWYRDGYWTTVQKLFRPLKSGGPVKPLANSNLINGKMRFPCGKTSLPCVTASYAKFNFTSGKNHKLRLMNVGSGAVQKFSIDGHTLQVVATDYMPVKPYNTSMVALGVGQRADVIVFGSGKQGQKYWMRSNMVGCSLNDGVLTEARAAIYYQGADPKTLPTAPANQGPAAGTDVRQCGGDPLSVTEPSYPLAAAKPDAVRTFEIRTKNNGTNIIYTFGEKAFSRTFRANFNEPLRRKALDNTIIEVDPTRNLWYLQNAKVARAIIYNYNDAPHPIHYHGHNMQILSVGMGKWDGTIVRPSNPQRRDVQMMPPGSDEMPSYLVVQWDVDNPGIWPLHCHFAWHSSMGLVANVVEPSVLGIQSSLTSALPQIKGICDGWEDYLKKSGSLLTGIDSGL